MKELTDSTFDEFVKEGLVVVDFYAEWCSPCRKLGELLEHLQLNFSNVKFAKVNIENCAEITTEFGVRSLPTLILFKDGVKVDRVEGLLPECKLVDRFKALRKG